MKKRKELDALVSNGKIGSSKRITCIKKASGSCSAHELLRHETDSSDMEDFSILQPRRKSRKKHGGRFCLTSVCLSLCQFILVTTSCLVSGALIWLHIGLREDIDLLRTHLQKVEAGSRNTPEALHVIHSSLKQLDSNSTMLYIEVRKNIADIENITNEINSLKATVGELKASIAAAPAIEQLPKDMHSLSESVANFGSKLTALESNIKELKDQQSNMQTTAQNLSGELDSVKNSVQDLTNFTEIQGKSSMNNPSDNKLQNGLHEANQNITNLREKLTEVLKSVDRINSSLSTYYEMPKKIETLNEAMILINNKTLFQNSHLQALESFIHSNLSLQFEQIEPERLVSFKKTDGTEMEENINKTLTETLHQLINKQVFHLDAHASDSSNLLPFEQTHDVLVLLAALLQKFEQMPQSYVLSNKNATDLVERMLRNSFEETVLSRDIKFESLEHKVQNLSSCIPDCQSQDVVTEHDESSHSSTSVFVHSTLTPDTQHSDDSEAQLADALG